MATSTGWGKVDSETILKREYAASRETRQSNISTRRSGTRKHQTMSFSVLVLHGPNLSLLAGEQIDPLLGKRAAELGVELISLQSNGEPGLLDALHEHAQEIDGVLVNPGALAPNAFALAEGLQMMRLPAVEVLLEALPAERGTSSLTGVVKHQVHGLGIDGYVKGLELLVPAGKPRATEPLEDSDEEEPNVSQTRGRGKSIGRKKPVVALATVAPTRAKTIGRGPSGGRAVTPGVPSHQLTRTQVRERIKQRLKGTETAAGLAQWARETWTYLQRGAPVEAGAKEIIENVLLTLMAGAKASDQILVSQMAKLDP